MALQSNVDQPPTTHFHPVPLGCAVELCISSSHKSFMTLLPALRIENDGLLLITGETPPQWQESGHLIPKP